MANRLVFVLGGTRSGKSRYALERTRQLAGDGRAWVVATARPGDPEMDDRIARHRRARPSTWPTIDVDADLAAAIMRSDPGEPLLIEGLTLWLSALLGDVPPEVDAVLDGPVEAALVAIANRAGPVVIVSDEIGLGTVPMHPLTRGFRDLVGLTHQRIARDADEVLFVVAGLPLTLKPDPGR
jgi:adenosylcobinamide kinase/adenosylcobinamide-phosphate guanylyltransferase